MNLEELFEPTYVSDRDTDTHRVCGTCGELKPVTEFYKDGKTRDGTIKYRRDCKACYKKTRLYEERIKRRK